MVAGSLSSPLPSLIGGPSQRLTVWGQIVIQLADLTPMRFLDKLLVRLAPTPDERLAAVGSACSHIAAQDKVQFPNYDPRYAYPAILEPFLERLRAIGTALEEIADLAGVRHPLLLRTRQDLKDCANRAIRLAYACDPRPPVEAVPRPIICNILADDSRDCGMRVWLEMPRHYRTSTCAVWDRDEALYLAGRVVRNKPIQCLVRPGKFSKQAVQAAFGLCPTTEPLQLKGAADETATWYGAKA